MVSPRGTGMALVFGICLFACRPAPPPAESPNPSATPMPVRASEPATSKPTGPRPLTAVVFERTAARAARGRTLAEGALQCVLCHSERDWSQPGAPPVAGRRGAGRVWKRPSWLVAPNLTSDVETGAGRWSDDMIARAIREGVSHDGRVLHPQMWSSSFRG